MEALQTESEGWENAVFMTFGKRSNLKRTLVGMVPFSVQLTSQQC